MSNNVTKKQMKTSNIIIICLLSSFQLMAQPTHPSDEIMQFTYPKGTEKLDERSYKDFCKKFDETLITKFDQHEYKKDALFFYYQNLSHPSILKKSLENRLKLMASLTAQVPGNIVDDSEIISVNNIRFFIIRYHEKNDWYLWFSSDYDKNLRFINGFIEYKKPDDAEATQYLHDLLQSMHFKDN
jgi:hypothetical protein